MDPDEPRGWWNKHLYDGSNVEVKPRPSPLIRDCMHGPMQPTNGTFTGRQGLSMMSNARRANRPSPRICDDQIVDTQTSSPQYLRDRRVRAASSLRSSKPSGFFHASNEEDYECEMMRIESHDDYSYNAYEPSKPQSVSKESKIEGLLQKLLDAHEKTYREIDEKLESNKMELDAKLDEVSERVSKVEEGLLNVQSDLQTIKEDLQHQHQKTLSLERTLGCIEDRFEWEIGVLQKKLTNPAPSVDWEEDQVCHDFEDEKEEASAESFSSLGANKESNDASSDVVSQQSPDGSLKSEEESEIGTDSPPHDNASSRWSEPCRPHGQASDVRPTTLLPHGEAPSVRPDQPQPPDPVDSPPHGETSSVRRSTDPGYEDDPDEPDPPNVDQTVSPFIVIPHHDGDNEYGPLEATEEPKPGKDKELNRLELEEGSGNLVNKQPNLTKKGEGEEKEVLYEKGKPPENPKETGKSLSINISEMPLIVLQETKEGGTLKRGDEPMKTLGELAEASPCPDPLIDRTMLEGKEESCPNKPSSAFDKEGIGKGEANASPESPFDCAMLVGTEKQNPTEPCIAAKPQIAEVGFDEEGRAKEEDKEAMELGEAFAMSSEELTIANPRSKILAGQDEPNGGETSNPPKTSSVTSPQSIGNLFLEKEKEARWKEKELLGSLEEPPWQAREESKEGTCSLITCTPNNSPARGIDVWDVAEEMRRRNLSFRTVQNRFKWPYGRTKDRPSPMHRPHGRALGVRRSIYRPHGRDGAMRRSTSPSNEPILASQPQVCATTTTFCDPVLQENNEEGNNRTPDGCEGWSSEDIDAYYAEQAIEMNLRDYSREDVTYDDFSTDEDEDREPREAYSYMATQDNSAEDDDVQRFRKEVEVIERGDSRPRRPCTPRILPAEPLPPYGRCRPHRPCLANPHDDRSFIRMPHEIFQERGMSVSRPKEREDRLEILMSGYADYQKLLEKTLHDKIDKTNVTLSARIAEVWSHIRHGGQGVGDLEATEERLQWVERAISSHFAKILKGEKANEEARTLIGKLFNLCDSISEATKGRDDDMSAKIEKLERKMAHEIFLRDVLQMRISDLEEILSDELVRCIRSQDLLQEIDSTLKEKYREIDRRLNEFACRVTGRDIDEVDEEERSSNDDKEERPDLRTLYHIMKSRRRSHPLREFERGETSGERGNQPFEGMEDDLMIDVEERPKETKEEASSPSA